MCVGGVLLAAHRILQLSPSPHPPMSPPTLSTSGLLWATPPPPPYLHLPLPLPPLSP